MQPGDTSEEQPEITAVPKGTDRPWWEEQPQRNYGTQPLNEEAVVGETGRLDMASGSEARIKQPRRTGFAAAALRDIGQVREVNQDHVFTLTSSLPREGNDIHMGLFIVADGMGGHDSGEIASRMAVSAVTRTILGDLMIPALDEDMSQPLQPLIISAVEAANRSIWEYAQSINSDMGTTCTVALLLGHGLYIGHVGDTRAYVIGPDGIRQITDDHSAVGRLIQLGQLDPAEARDHPLRSHIYRTVGQNLDLQVDFAYEQTGSATHLLICSDGLWGLVDETAMQEVLAQAVWPHEACRELIDRANQAGGDDNISVVIVTLPGNM